jgi:geranylgeranyl diphosphate synthase, type I
MQLPGVFEKYRAAIEAELRSILDGRQSPLYDMMRYHLGWTDEAGREREGSAGKALRPTLCLLACEAAGGDYRRALPVAAAIELVHNFSLIHDDIQDDDRQRRHRPTVWAVWGKPQAINAGTAMRILTNVAVSRLDRLGIPPEKVLLVQRLVDEASLRLIEGQYLDIDYEKRLGITVENYLRMIGGKTAALIAGALEVGARLGTDDGPVIEAFHSLGWNLGLGFQVRDDILGIWGDRDLTGKPLAGDIRRRKKTLPVVHALENARDGYRERLERFYGDGGGDGSVADILDILDRAGAQAYAQAMNESYCREARRILAGLDIDAGARQDFAELIAFLEIRGF